jgi:hypothetical protein
VQHEGVQAGVPAHEDPDGPARGLGPQRLPGRRGGAEAVGDRAPQVGGLVDLLEVDGDPSPGGRRQAAQPRQVVGHLGVVQGHLDDAVAGVADRLTDGEELGDVSGGAGDQLAVDRAVQRGPRRAEPERSGGEGLAGEAGHLGEVVGGGGASVAPRSPIT